MLQSVSSISCHVFFGTSKYAYMAGAKLERTLTLLLRHFKSTWRTCKLKLKKLIIFIISPNWVSQKFFVTTMGVSLSVSAQYQVWLFQIQSAHYQGLCESDTAPFDVIEKPTTTTVLNLLYSTSTFNFLPVFIQFQSLLLPLLSVFIVYHAHCFFVVF